MYRGASLAYWSKALIQPDAELHAFDSFEGLPEAFDLFGEYRKGRFDVKGQLPGIKDDRITYHKGWFEDTLPPFIVPDSPQLVVTLDADLYSSTILVLKLLAAHIKPGAILYFDDMSRPEHEPKAFGEFMDEFGFSFETVAVDRSLNAAAFRCTTSGHRSGSAR